MAESTTAALPRTPSANIGLATALPDTPSSIASPIDSSRVAPDASSFLVPTNPRKRPRPLDNSPVAALAASGVGKLPGPASPKSAFSTLSPPVHLTVAAEMVEQKKRKTDLERSLAKQQSPNPQRKAIGALLGEQESMSRPQDAPTATNTLNPAIASVASSISTKDAAAAEGSMQTSPVSMSSLGTLESVGDLTMTANGAQVTSPGPIADEESGGPDAAKPRTPTRGDTEDSYSNKALTYPGPLFNAQMSDARRGMSLPGGFSRDDSKSPQSSNKKHKCPYCSTEFTRHHNLKSHLLTHSHEKPFMCQTCDSRFRRLHDLKRHTKLHTGERPHICPKCKRSFARGDALARHNKGQGGCAGRRSSVGSFGGDGSGPGGDESMDGLLYTGEASHEPENMDDETEGLDDRGQSLPSIRTHDAPPAPHYQHSPEGQPTYQARQASTYPPIATRPPTGATLYPPARNGPGGPSAATSPSNTLNQYGTGSGSNAPQGYQSGGPNVFGHGSMTDSPKPLSPGGMGGPPHGHPDSNIHRNRSPSLTQQFQQQQYRGRGPHGRATPPPSMGLPPPMSSTGHSNPPHLPSLHGLTPPDSRYTLHNQVPGPSHTSSLSQSSLPGPPHPSGSASGSYPPPQGNLLSQSNSYSSHGTQPLGSGERANIPYNIQPEDRLWAVIKALEQKVDRLQEEVNSLRAHISGPPPHR